MPRKRHLTEDEKRAIWRYHKEHPLVTHSDVGAFFGVERSTVSKIVHQHYYQDHTDDSGFSVPAKPDNVNPPRPDYKAQCALVEYQKISDRRGLSVTRAMMRKKAAIEAAKSWLGQNQQGTHAATAKDGSCGKSHPIGGTQDIDGTMMSTDIFFGFTEEDNVDGWINPELNHDQAGIPSGNTMLCSDSPVYSNESGHSNELEDYMKTFSALENVPLQDLVQPKKEGRLHLEAVKALNVLSQQLAQLDEVTTCDVICLSHLEDRMRRLTVARV